MVRLRRTDRSTERGIDLTNYSKSLNLNLWYDSHLKWRIFMSSYAATRTEGHTGLKSIFFFFFATLLIALSG